MGNKNLQQELDEALLNCDRLREENKLLKEILRQEGIALPHPAGVKQAPSPTSASKLNNNSPVESKIALFRDLFRGRADVYPVRWENKKGKAGYSPACRHEWNRAFCDKPRVKCGQCENREFLPVTDKVIYDHLVGRHTIGVYPLLADETCWFLAADFDKSSWQEDVTAYLDICEEAGVPAVVERSRSGKGAHVWVFFSDPIAAVTARKLGCYLLTKAMDSRHQLGFDSYDRFFPNQDTLPKGGFGNLIALPFQKGPRAAGNSSFVDSEFDPYPDQWAFLSSVTKFSEREAELLASEAVKKGEVVGVKLSQTDDEANEDPWTLPPSGKGKELPIKGPLPSQVNAVLADLLYIEKETLPPVLLNRLNRLAAFQNPEFYKNQAMRLPTYDKPRIISCSEDFAKHLGLPRGCLSDATQLLNGLGVELILRRMNVQPASRLRSHSRGACVNSSVRQ